MNAQISKQRMINLVDIASCFLAIYYTWYALPFMRVTFQTSLYKYLFFGCYVIGAMLLLIAQLGRIDLDIPIKRWRSILICILPYMAVMFICYILKAGDASKHIRVSFTFWGTALIYCLFSVDEKAKIRFGKYLAFLFCVTAVTSVIGVLADSSAARAISNASQREENVARDYELMRKNISGVYLFQCLTVLVPAAIMGIRKRKQTAMWVFVLAFITLAVLKASFTILLLVFAAGCFLTLISNRRIPIVIIMVFVVLVLLLMPLDSCFEYLASIIQNHYVSTRLSEIAEFFSGATLRGDMRTRITCYLYSIRTFLQNPFGVGAWYSYVIGQHGIGFHSEILDDLARYGVFALAFYIVYFIEYHYMIRRQWGKVGLSGAALPVCVTYFLFLLLNIGFRSADESIFMLYVLPILPELFRQPQRKRSG